MNTKKLIKLIPLLIVNGAMIYSIYLVSTTHIVLTPKHYIGFLLLLCCSVLYFFDQRKGRWLLLSVLVLGAFNVVAFTAIVYTYNIGFSLNGAGGGMTLQEFSLIMLFVFLVFHMDNLVRRLDKYRK